MSLADEDQQPKYDESCKISKGCWDPSRLPPRVTTTWISD